MNNTKERKLLISIDVDSPAKLLNFYRIHDQTFDVSRLESFYEMAWARALDFFEKLNIKATFFVVGDELEKSEVIRKIVLNAHKLGHEIENHTYSHPFGLASMPEEKIREEILLCNQIIEKTTSVKPMGFRSPGYNLNSKVLHIAEDLGLKYDSSGFWSVMNPILKISHKLLFKNGLNSADFGFVSSKLKQYPYRPSVNDWLVPDPHSKGILELPFPRTTALGLPFYNNFNLWTPSFYSNYISKRIHKPYLMYLFHIIEFMDLTDNIPKELAMHPNVSASVKNKIQQSEKIVLNLMEQYEFMRTRDFANSILAEK